MGRGFSAHNVHNVSNLNNHETVKEQLTRVGINEPCPCGSGMKYKRCCWDKGFTWERNAQGDLFRKLPVPREVVAYLEQQRQEYIATHGKEPDPDSPLFPALAEKSDEEISNEMATIMEMAGSDPAYIYAFRKTGFIVTELNQHLMPDCDVQEWIAAVEEYRLQYN